MKPRRHIKMEVFLKRKQPTTDNSRPFKHPSYIQVESCIQASSPLSGATRPGDPGAKTVLHPTLASLPGRGEADLLHVMLERHMFEDVGNRSKYKQYIYIIYIICIYT